MILGSAVEPSDLTFLRYLSDSDSDDSMERCAWRCQCADQ